MKRMLQAFHVGKSVADNTLGMFKKFSRYKLGKRGEKPIKIDKWLPASKARSCCDQVKKPVSLSE
ncbi:hypothetical protein BK704_01300 [[Bacillus thuringiensis] serovar konkukian]|nr:hypothetical protein BK704_28965 [[Bacillus thuringiensis] serovar konkukian]OUB17883.1 hypothetical protein BK704_01335 [[Bacillus thuringiensis] serovar konkukian]OUB17901.1 hypothetical protein BK704_01300 [[Bacillus thuringiensis] serovar konkukian]